MYAHSSVKLLDKVKHDKNNFLKAQMNLFDKVILHQDFSFQSKKVLKFFTYAIIILLILLLLNFTGFVCSLKSSVKPFEKVINNTINLFKAENLCHKASCLSEHT